MMNLLKRLVKEESGQALTEYGLIIALIAILIIAALTGLKDSIAGVFQRISDQLNGATPS